MTGLSHPDSGMLAHIPAQYISAAIDRMPDPGAPTAKIRAVEIDVPELGRVRITCVLRRNWWRDHQFWSAVRADIAP
jgi:hypothetical protein